MYRSQSVAALLHSMWTFAFPLSTSGWPLIVNGIDSCGPSSGFEPVFSAGCPSGLANAIGSCGLATGLRPNRPATYGRVDGLSAQLNRPPGALSVDVSTSVYRIGSPTLPSGAVTGAVGVWNSLRTRSL